MSGPNYTSIDHTKSFAGEADWVQAAPLEQTLLPSPGKHSATVILLHGFANSGAAWIPIARYLQASHPHIRFHLINAPIINVHVPHGEAALPAWWDAHITTNPLLWNEEPIEDQEGLARSKLTVEQLIDDEVALVGRGRVFLGGFSQGGVLALATGSRNSQIGGIIVLSSWLSVADSIDSKISGDTQLEKAIFWAHGKDDVRLNDQAKQSIDYLTETVGFRRINVQVDDDQPGPGTISVRFYDDLAHATRTEEIEDVSKWLGVTLEPK